MGSKWTLRVWLKLPLGTTEPINGPINEPAGRRHTLADGYLQSAVLIETGGIESNGYIGARCGVSNTVFEPIVSLASKSAGWHHLTVVGQSGKQHFYFDALAAGSTVAQCTRDLLCIGNACLGGSSWNGLISEFQMFVQPMKTNEN